MSIVAVQFFFLCRLRHKTYFEHYMVYVCSLIFLFYDFAGSPAPFTTNLLFLESAVAILKGETWKVWGPFRHILLVS